MDGGNPAMPVQQGQTLIQTLMAAAKREEELIYALVSAVHCGDESAILKAARNIADNRAQPVPPEPNQ